MHKSISKDLISKMQGWAIAVPSIITSLAMMHGDSTLVSPAVQSLIRIPNYIAAIFLLLLILNEKKSFKVFVPLFVCVLVSWVIMTFHLFEKEKLSISPLILILLLIFSSLKDQALLYAFKLFRWYLVLTSFYGILSYLSYSLGLGLPYEEVAYYGKGGTTGWFYLNYYLSYSVLSLDGLRLCGLFNEPGYFGTIIALYLISDNVDFRKVSNVILFVAGCLTFSLAYFSLLIIYALIAVLKKPKYIIAFFLLAIVVISILPYLEKRSDMVGILLERFSFENGGLAGDNRTTLSFDMYFKRMLSNGDFLIGYGTGFLKFIDSGSLSYKCVILEHGFIGVIIMWGTLLWASIKKSGKDRFAKIFVTIFFVSIYQRPNVIALYYLLLLFGGIIYIHKNHKNQEKNAL